MATLHGSERAHIMPLPDAIRRRTGKHGGPRKRPKVLATDTGYDTKGLHQQLRTWGIRVQSPKRVWNTTKRCGRPIKSDVPRFQAEWTFAWFRKKSRRLVVRWQRLAVCFATLLAMAPIHLWMQRLRVRSIHRVVVLVAGQ